MTQLAIFIILTMANVILSTTKSLITVNGGKWSAAFANAVTYGVYTYLIFFTALDGVELWQKALITFICNLKEFMNNKRINIYDGSYDSILLFLERKS